MARNCEKWKNADVKSEKCNKKGQEKIAKLNKNSKKRSEKEKKNRK